MTGTLQPAEPTDDGVDDCSRCTCWIWEALGWLPPNHRCADLFGKKAAAESEVTG
jgi:hypothetical protein